MARKTFIERIINRCLPLDADYKALLRTKREYLAARRDYYLEQARLEKARNDAVLEAEAAENEREKKRREKWRTVATYDTPSDLVYGEKPGKTVDITYDLVLYESEVARKIEAKAQYKEGSRPILDEVMINRVMKFAMGQSFWIAWFRPWLEGTLDIEDLRKLKGFRVIGEKVQKPHPDAYVEPDDSEAA